MSEIPKDWMPLLTWPKFFYNQQIEFTKSDKKEVWFIGGNGTGKTLVFYLNLVLQLLGIHPQQMGKPPIIARILVPSFDNVEKVALEKLLQPQRIIFTELSDKQKAWIELLDKEGQLLDYVKGESFEIGPMLPKSVQITNKGFKKEHRGIELKKMYGGSKMWWVTSEMGWELLRGAEQDIQGVDEESKWDEFNQVKRGLRNAKGGGRIYGALTPPYKEGMGPTWTKEHVVDAAVEDDSIHVVNACMADNPAITPQYIEWWSRGKTQKQLDVEVWGKYPTWGDLVHPDFQDRLWDAKKVDGHLLRNDTPMPENHDVNWVMAFDWHASKPCAAVFGFIDSDGNVTFFDELDRDVAEDRTIDELANIFRQIEGEPHNDRKFRRWQDPSAKSQYQAVQRGFNAWDAFRKAGIITSAGRNRDPLVGISTVNEYFRGNRKDHPRVFIYERCKYLRQYLVNHFWQRGEDGVGKPDARWSDYPISLRYILQEIGWKIHSRRRRKWPLASYESIKPKRQVFDISRMER